MNIKKTVLAAAVALAAGMGSAHAAIIVTDNTNAADLVAAIVGTGITTSNPVLTFNNATRPTGLFSGGGSAIGFDSGIALTTGTIGCIPGPNNSGSCDDLSAPGIDFFTPSSTSLSFDFTTTTGDVYFNFVFGSEEYNQYVGSQFNDRFELRLNGTNIARLPNNDIISINTVNCSSNASLYRNNNVEDPTPAGCTNLGLDTQLDGLTTVLTISASGLVGTNNFEFFITDVGDGALDSAVLIQAGTFGGVTPEPPPNGVPTPGTLALAGLALAAMAARRRKV